MKGSLAVAPSSALLASGSRLAAFAAVLCGVHCALTPVLAAVAPALALSEGVERAGWAGTVALGAAVLALAPSRRNPVVVLTFLAGATLWGASLAGWLEPLPEVATSVAGGLILAVAMVRSAHICHSAACAVCGD